MCSTESSRTHDVLQHLLLVGSMWSLLLIGCLFLYQWSRLWYLWPGNFRGSAGQQFPLYASLGLLGRAKCCGVVAKTFCSPQICYKMQAVLLMSFFGNQRLANVKLLVCNIWRLQRAELFRFLEYVYRGVSADESLYPGTPAVYRRRWNHLYWVFLASLVLCTWHLQECEVEDL